MLILVADKVYNHFWSDDR